MCIPLNKPEACFSMTKMKQRQKYLTVGKVKADVLRSEASFRRNCIIHQKTPGTSAQEKGMVSLFLGTEGMPLLLPCFPDNKTYPQNKT